MLRNHKKPLGGCYVLAKIRSICVDVRKKFDEVMLGQEGFGFELLNRVRSATPIQSDESNGGGKQRASTSRLEAVIRAT